MQPVPPSLTEAYCAGEAEEGGRHNGHVACWGGELGKWELGEWTGGRIQTAEIRIPPPTARRPSCPPPAATRGSPPLTKVHECGHQLGDVQLGVEVEEGIEEEVEGGGAAGEVGAPPPVVVLCAGSKGEGRVGGRVGREGGRVRAERSCSGAVARQHARRTADPGRAPSEAEAAQQCTGGCSSTVCRQAARAHRSRAGSRPARW